MKKILSLLMSVVLLLGITITPVWAGGGKVQHENGQEVGSGSDAQENQVNGD